MHRQTYSYFIKVKKILTYLTTYLVESDSEKISIALHQLVSLP